MSTRHHRSTIPADDYSYVNENQIDQELICMICQQPFFSPMVGKNCGHTFCSSCINDWYKQNSSCPSCRQKTSFVPVTTRVVVSQLDRLLVRCHHCNENNIQRGDFPDHMQKRCRQVPVKCIASDLKCPWTGSREQLSQHLELCPLVLIRPVVEDIRGELSAQAYQLRMFMDEVRDLLRNHQQQRIQPNTLETRTKQDHHRGDSKKERYHQLINNLMYAWTDRQCPGGRSAKCSFCKNPNERFLKCLCCSLTVARDNLRMHDYSGGENNVLCRACVDKYSNYTPGVRSMLAY